MPTIVRTAEDITQLAETLPENELMVAWQALTEGLRKRLPGSRWIDLAAHTAANHPGLRGRGQAVRALLAVEAGWQDLVERVAGAPRHVADLDQVTDSSLKQARIAGEAVAAIWDEELLPSAEVARRLGAKPSNREKVNSLRRRSSLLGLPRDRGRLYLYPAFQIDVTRQEIYPQVMEVNRLLDAAADPWGVASWWVSVNGRLDARPLDLVDSPDAAAVLQAARAVVEPLG